MYVMFCDGYIRSLANIGTHLGTALTPNILDNIHVINFSDNILHFDTNILKLLACTFHTYIHCDCESKETS